MSDKVILTMPDTRTVEVLTLLDHGRCTVAQAQKLLRLSERQIHRKLAGFRRKGLASVPHGNRGRPPANRLPEADRLRVAELLADAYRTCNNHHVVDLLRRDHQLQVSVSTVRRIRLDLGERSPRRRTPQKPRRPRERKPQVGMMQQIDGSPHRWLGPDGPEFSLLAAVDDATGLLTGALFRCQEDCVGYLRLLEQMISHYGIPLSLYCDHHEIFFPSANQKLTLEEELAGRHKALTQFGRAAHELGITMIPAGSPQAKGRVERRFELLQDRLLQELRLAGITTLEDANAFLPTFVAEHNQRFAQLPAEPDSAWRPAPAPQELWATLSLRYHRVADNNNCLSFGNRQLRLPDDQQSHARRRIELRFATDGQTSFWYQGCCLGLGPRCDGELRTEEKLLAALLPLPPKPKRRPEATPAKSSRLPGTAVTPAKDHPWRRFRYGKEPSTGATISGPAGG